ncbi:S1/P1 nuclease [Gracilimonas sediminicola]|uniref:S1/P1 nuclease n=1 Tax=Gracilimonas sediminicola TaxID=2952158 RepID=A0A9X2RDB0_9BACT|nr:S1/P1 nuclease [Gracilimonas sediminicola]MCP9290382.1 S1/P1 nuclease [Gracilimonas sediminicola]
MNKLLTLISIFALGFTSTANEALRWGQIGHRTTGHVAEQYLTDKAAAEVERVLGNESLAEVSTWMDEVRSDDAYDFMAPWHYVTIPEGETYETVEKAEGGDIIWALEKVVKELKEGNLTQKQEEENLKILVHLVGDLHQPLHVGNGTDRGGNDVKLQWFWSNSNLHRVWDSEMIDDKQLSYTELSDFVNHPTEEQINEWQSTSIRDWAYESQDLLPQVYDFPEDKELSYEYSYKNWNTVEQRLVKAGVRMAGLINEIYE